MDNSTRTLLAIGIAEYQQAHDALYSLFKMGLGVHLGAMSRIRLEQRLLMTRWQRSFADRSAVVNTDNWGEIVNEVRAWITEHSEEVDRLLITERR